MPRLTILSRVFSVACGVCLVLTALAAPAFADDPLPTTPPVAADCPNPTRDACKDEVTRFTCLAASGCDADNGDYCNCTFRDLPDFKCYCP